MEEFESASVAQPRFTALLLAGFAMLAMSLALVGVYGVMAYIVSQRRREIGVRMALGAERPDVVWMVCGHGVALAGIGIAMLSDVDPLISLRTGSGATGEDIAPHQLEPEQIDCAWPGGIDAGHERVDVAAG